MNKIIKPKFSIDEIILFRKPNINGEQKGLIKKIIRVFAEQENGKHKLKGERISEDEINPTQTNHTIEGDILMIHYLPNKLQIERFVTYKLYDYNYFIETPSTFGIYSQSQLMHS